MAELKPCKCRKIPVLISYCKEGFDAGNYIYCFGCNKCTEKYTTKQQAIDAWNKRK